MAFVLKWFWCLNNYFGLNNDLCLKYVTECESDFFFSHILSQIFVCGLVNLLITVSIVGKIIFYWIGSSKIKCAIRLEPI